MTENRALVEVAEIARHAKTDTEVKLILLGLGHVLCGRTLTRQQGRGDNGKGCGELAEIFHLECQYMGLNV